MSKVKLTLVRPKDLTHEELSRLFAARELNLGKPVEFSHMLRNVWEGKWALYRIDGAISGVAVLQVDGEALNIYYLHGDGLFGKIEPLKRRLMDIARKQGCTSLVCLTRSKAAARLFSMAKGIETVHRGNWYLLEYKDGRQD